jgi:hypothetical protein
LEAQLNIDRSRAELILSESGTLELVDEDGKIIPAEIEQPPVSYQTLNTQDLQSLAAALLSDDQCKFLFQRVGIDGDMTADEEVVVDRFMRKYQADAGWAGPAGWTCLAIATSLVRAICGGEVDAPHTDTARAFVQYRLGIDPATGMEWTGQAVIPPEDLLRIARDFVRDKPAFEIWKNTLTRWKTDDERVVVHRAWHRARVKYGVIQGQFMEARNAVDRFATDPNTDMHDPNILKPEPLVE